MTNYMKNSIPFFFAIIIFAGCNATTSPNGTTTTPGSMTATVSGESWSSAVIPGGITGGATASRSNSGVVTVVGVASDITEITLVMNNPSVGTFPLGGLSADYGAYSEGILDTSKAWISIPWTTNLTPGSLTITQFDTVNRQISGTFSFTGRKLHTPNDSITVTGGSFYQVEWSK
jgi:hypothetical protein